MSGPRPERPETDFKEPVPWLIVVDSMDWDKAHEVVRALAGCGVTGTFRATTEAAMLQEYSAWKRERAREALAATAPRKPPGDGPPVGQKGPGNGAPEAPKAAGNGARNAPGEREMDHGKEVLDGG